MTQYFLNNLWRWKCGLPEKDIKKPKLDYQELKTSQWSIEFEKLMRSRLIMGAYRYGKLHDSKNSKLDRIGNMIHRLEQYQLTGNDELLVDVANLCLCEFEMGVHPNKHFNPIDDGVHCE